jgi:hypothetical protein
MLRPGAPLKSINLFPPPQFNNSCLSTATQQFHLRCAMAAPGSTLADAKFVNWRLAVHGPRKTSRSWPRNG